MLTGKKFFGYGCSGCLTMVVFMLVLHFFIGGLLVQYSLETWLEWHHGEPRDVPFWQCGLIAIPLAEVAIPAAIITWIWGMFR